MTDENDSPENEETEVEAEETETEETTESEESKETPSEEDTEETDEEEEKPKPKKKSGWQRRAERERRKAEQLERELAELKGKQPEVQEVKSPKREDFDNYEDYLEARADYVAEKKIQEKEDARQKKQQSESAKQEHDRLVSQWEGLKEDARDRYDDFDDVLDRSNAPLTPEMSRVIMESDFGGDITYYLATNEDEAERIASLSPAKQALALGRLESKLEAEIAKPKKAATSKAPDPAKPVKKKSPKTNALPSDDDDIDTWMEKENKRIKK